jgi:N-acetylglutamate synthase-like GNAT family acetyltransferase
MTPCTTSQAHSTAAGIHRELTTITERRRPTTGPDETMPTARIKVRELAPRDLGAIRDMAARCSDDTLRRRFHAPVAHLPLDRVTALLTASNAVGVVVAEVDGAVVGVGTLHLHGVHGDADAEMAVLVEDAWQSGGVGSRLTVGLLRVARRVGVRNVVADVLREPRFLVESLRHHHPTATVSVDGPVATVRLPVRAA